MPTDPAADLLRQSRLEHSPGDRQTLALQSIAASLLTITVELHALRDDVDPDARPYVPATVTPLRAVPIGKDVSHDGRRWPDQRR